MADLIATLDKMPEAARLKLAMAILGSRKTPAKAAASRRNGKLGGRPRKKVA